MDNRQFDSLVKTLTSGDSRRGILSTLGIGAVTAVFGRLGTEQAAEAKKKKRKKKKKKTKVQQCAGGTRSCGAQCIPQDACCLDADCGAQAPCVGGVCTGGGVVPECRSDAECGRAGKCVNGTCLGCLSDGDCAAQELCQNGTCVPRPGPQCVSNDQCDVGEVCFDGICVLIQGTCAAADDHCAVEEALCNPAAPDDCFCLQRFGGGVACTLGFVPGSTCGSCQSDAACDATAPGSVCVSALENGCPCEPGQGICARLCDNP